MIVHVLIELVLEYVKAGDYITLLGLQLDSRPLD